MKKLILYLLAFSSIALFAEPPAGSKWKLVWQDGFDYENRELDREWVSQNGPSSHIACSRWRENVDVKNGLLILTNKKEERGGQDWTSGSIWSKKVFKYGYFECRYKYAKHPTTNNSFWLMTQEWQKKQISKGKAFEIDINEGWYPDIIRTNIHNWSDFWTDDDGNKMHHQYHKLYQLSPQSGSPDKSFELKKPVKAERLRFSSKHGKHFHLRSLRAWEPSGEYPDITQTKLSSEFIGMTDYAKGAKVVAHSPLNENFPSRSPDKALDGKIDTAWITASDDEEKFIEIDLGGLREIGCVQFLTGWPQRETGAYFDYVYNYKVEYFDGKKWNTIADVESDKITTIDLSEDFHTYALEWNEDELVYYFDGNPLRRSKNEFCHWESPVWLSLAILKTMGRKDDSLNGTHMDVDYVKVWQAEGTGATMRDAADEVKKK